MPALENTGRIQTVVYWRWDGSDAYGQPKVAQPTDLNVRLELVKRASITPQGTPIRIDGTLYQLPRSVVEGSLIWLEGTVADLPDPYSAVTNLYRVISYEETPDIKGRNTGRSAAIVIYSDKLPTLTANPS